MQVRWFTDTATDVRLAASYVITFKKNLYMSAYSVRFFNESSSNTRLKVHSRLLGEIVRGKGEVKIL